MKISRKEIKVYTIDQSNDATSINNHRGLARRAKRQSSKRLRRLIHKRCQL